MLIIELMSEASRRFKGPGGSLRVLLDDVPLQAAYCLDAPDEVQDGMEWYSDPDFADISGPVPRFVEVREPANTPAETRQTVHKGTP